MSSIIFMFLLVPFVAFLLIGLNLLLAPHKPYKEKQSEFECGFHSFLGQNRSQFSISFFLFGLLFLIFDLEIVLIYPYVVSAYTNTSYGLTVVFAFLIILTAGFVFSSANLGRRINQYFSLAFLNTHKKSSYICRALLKYGYSQFRNIGIL